MPGRQHLNKTFSCLDEDLQEAVLGNSVTANTHLVLAVPGTSLELYVD